MPPPPRVRLGPWDEFLDASRPSVDWQGVGFVLCLDPGLTTGWAIFNEGILDSTGQWNTPSPDVIAEFISDLHGFEGSLRTPLSLIVFEEYRVRGNKFKEHVGSEVVTIQHIGAIKVAASMIDVPVWKQTAGQVKAFCTDHKLRAWGLYQPGQKHANDAIRHGCYYHLFVAGRER